MALSKTLFSQYSLLPLSLYVCVCVREREGETLENDTSSIYKELIAQ